jgi:hypothetical protein
MDHLACQQTPHADVAEVLCAFSKALQLALSFVANLSDANVEIDRNRAFVRTSGAFVRSVRRSSRKNKCEEETNENSVHHGQPLAR